ncbi:MAG: Z1 domain-containing protein [Spirosoma sp.]|nr:Z1 domain-containing protein [Spirosoma sp.]
MTADLIKNFANTTLAQETGALSDARIAEVVDQFLGLAPGVVAQREDILNYLRSRFSVSQDAYQILDTDVANRVPPWVKDRRASGELIWQFWERYRLYMQPKLAAPTLNQLDDLTNDILDRLSNPQTPGPWERRGMVVGQVQSGKTGNYVGLMNKAADAGYKVIIVLAGLHDTLRNQTQVRIDEGFLGFNPTADALSLAKANNRIGVGKFNKNLAVNALTTRLGDFSKQVAQRSAIPVTSSDPIVLVIKKNPSILKNLILWLAAQGETRDGKKLIEDVPLLLIDDEADNASINTSKESISTINGLIRALLSLFNQSAYVGYTATPFANIFIPIQDEAVAKGLDTKIKGFDFKVGQDLFPRDFIINIPAPSNYVGPAKVFGLPAAAQSEQSEEALPIVVNLDRDKGTPGDYADFVPDKHKKDDSKPSQLPPSLIRAVRHFVLVCAARQARQQTSQHNSMLVHVSRFVPWIDRIALLVDQTLKDYQRQIEFNTGPLWGELEKMWADEFVPVTATIKNDMDADPNGYKDSEIQPIAWFAIRENLFSTIMKIEVRAVHGQSKTTNLEYHNITPLNYAQAEDEVPPRYLSIIAVGGDKLSRGLTLEGLSISYYLRASKMYDTLMQMGRWFGYRPGYVDLCRLFTSSDLIDWYKFITIASEEVREDFDRMFMLDQTPRDFGLKVRCHPDVLTVTALNKFRDARPMDLSYSAELEQSRRLKIDERTFRHNLDSVERLLPQMGPTVMPPNATSARRTNHVWRTNSYVVCQFLREYRIEPIVMDMPKIIDYIEQQTSNDDLIEWTVVLMNNSQAGQDNSWDFSIGGAPTPVGLTSRSNPSKNTGFYEIGKSQIISPTSGDEYIDLNNEQVNQAQKETEEDWIKKGKTEKRPAYPSTFRIKYNRPSSKGLLLIYPLNPAVEMPVPGSKPEEKKKETCIISPVPVIGLAISFPRIKNDRKIKYFVNQQYNMEYDYDDTLPEMSNE